MYFDLTKSGIDYEKQPAGKTNFLSINEIFRKYIYTI